MPNPIGLRPRAVPGRTLSGVAEHVGVPVPPGSAWAGRQASGITHDSRAVRPGDVYAALPGAHTHGARFVGEAAAAGAVAVLTDPAGRDDVERAGLPALVVADPRARLGQLSSWVYGEPSRALTTIGVTGTNGKTTTAYLVEGIMAAAGRRTGLLGTVETRIGRDVLPSARTTPEAPDLQALLAVMVERGVQAVAMEVSSHALVLGRVDGTAFDVAVFTNLGHDHLDFHADVEDYFAAKASLFVPDRARHAVVNVDDAYGARLAREVAVPVTTVSPHGEGPADWLVLDQAPSASTATTAFTLRQGSSAAGGGTELRLHSPLPGDFNVANAALAAVTCLTLGVPADVVASGLAAAPVAPGRLERVLPAAPGRPLGLVDYAHTPDAVETVLRALRPMVRGRLVVVLGAGGDRDRAKRPLMGAAAARQADVVVVTDDNPRSEDPATIRAAVLSGARAEASRSGARVLEVLEVGDRGEAIRRAVGAAEPDDVILVAGKGHEQGQDVAGTVLPFDDRRVLRDELATRPPSEGDVQ